ncbi:squalene/phytoene synthase family protein [Streptantibioticus cattleyicolor]|uniref:Putative phytoene synthase n=1 Tax=Streptantibioticus cattleyicolor (strain ATCC 35852 / DSM 46488 / JCM 4925 / NBRC 14057 / NRRL 8057) TaxID=1003195 RepID=F8JNJ6_STREN|nr:squalene/phytoene synthase family protein [Streptantibioticus cattleyicolor]AEW99035.1 putative phytoene synthase [Streptantibioticus cattleyicolor NRRL 8057 = DSM 46488]CCB71916.1 Putative phytoene synthase (modular protein) [Streptantibioticus cattleyicolor NRRL 8057 = DSM 46488]
MSTRDLDAAGLTEPHLRAAYAGAARYLSRRNSAAYPVTRCLLPPGKRPYWDAILAFSTYVDDLVDDPGAAPECRVARYEGYERAFFRLLDGDDPWDGDGDGVPRQRDGSGVAAAEDGRHFARAFAHFVRTWDIPADSVRQFMATIRTDLWVTEYPTFRDLERYIHGVCAQGSLWGNALLEPRGEEAAGKSAAVSFGLQLTDYLRDLHEDLTVGRLYVPLEDLERFGLERGELQAAAEERRMTEPLRDLVRFQVERARAFFDDAADWWRLVDPASCELPRQYVRLGRNSLEQIARADHDIFRGRPPHHLANTVWAAGGLYWGYLRTTGRRCARRVTGCSSGGC